MHFQLHIELSFIIINNTMLRNISYNNKTIKQEINSLTGNTFSFIDRFKMGGTGSQKFLIVHASDEINRLLSLDNNVNSCNIELRPKGIIVMFRSLLETFGWAIPYSKMSIYKQGDVYTFYAEEHKLSIKPAFNVSVNKKFIRKMYKLRSNYIQEQSPTAYY